MSSTGESSSSLTLIGLGDEPSEASPFVVLGVLFVFFLFALAVGARFVSDSFSAFEGDTCVAARMSSTITPYEYLRASTRKTFVWEGQDSHFSTRAR